MIPTEDFLLAAEAVLGIDAERLAQMARIELAESALAAPFASFEGHEFYVHPVQKAAVLVVFRAVAARELPEDRFELWTSRPSGLCELLEPPASAVGPRLSRRPPASLHSRLASDSTEQIG